MSTRFYKLDIYEEILNVSVKLFSLWDNLQRKNKNRETKTILSNSEYLRGRPKEKKKKQSVKIYRNKAKRLFIYFFFLLTFSANFYKKNKNKKKIEIIYYIKAIQSTTITATTTITNKIHKKKIFRWKMHTFVYKWSETLY